MNERNSGFFLEKRRRRREREASYQNFDDGADGAGIHSGEHDLRRVRQGADAHRTASRRFFLAERRQLLRNTSGRQVIPSFTVLPSFTEDYWVLPGFPKFLLCVVSFQVAWFYRVLPSFTEFYRVLPSFTEFYGSFQGFTLGLSERITGFYWVSPNFSYVS